MFQLLLSRYTSCSKSLAATSFCWKIRLQDPRFRHISWCQVRGMSLLQSSRYAVESRKPFVFGSSDWSARHSTLGPSEFLKTDVGTAYFYVSLLAWVFFGAIYYTSFYGVYLGRAPWRAIRIICLLLLAFGEVGKGRHNVISIVFLGLRRELWCKRPAT